MNKNSLYNKIPKVDDFLLLESIAALMARYPRPAVVDAVREELEALRSTIRNLTPETAEGFDVSREALALAVEERLSAIFGHHLKRVINASGVVIHTNLGRSWLRPPSWPIWLKSPADTPIWSSIWIPGDGAPATAMWRKSSAGLPGQKRPWWSTTMPLR